MLIWGGNVKYNVIVIGCGFAGATMAEKLSADSSNNILVIDQRNHIAGNMHDYVDENNILVHKYGPHLFHTNNKKIYDYLMQFGEWYNYEHQVKGMVDKKLIPIPFNLNSIDEAFDKETAERLKNILIKEYDMNNKVSILELLKHENKNIKELANYIYEKIFLHYTLKQWNLKPNEIDSKVLERVPIYISFDNRYFQDEYQILPKNGYTKIIENMLNKPNIQIKLNTNATDLIKIINNKIYFEGQAFDGKVIYTGSIDELLKYKYGTLPYRSLKFKSETITQKEFQPVTTVNYPSRDIEHTRITEYKHLALEQDNSEKTTIVKEYPCHYDKDSEERNIPYYPIELTCNQELYNKYKEELSKIPNLYLLGRLAEYKYYNMDEVINSALNLYELVKEEKPKVSIIVPVYNVEQYLRKCLDSLVNQTFKDIEIWTINDGSPDNSQAIIDEYCQKDRRIKSIIKENGGYGSVLEYAIKNITTDYFLICDPDDYLEDNAVELLYNSASKNEAELIYGKFYHLYNDGKKEAFDFSSFFVPEADTVYNENLDRFVFIPVSPHAKLYKTNTLKDLSFPKKVHFTDVLLYYYALSKIKSLAFVDEYLAYYLINREGNTHTDMNPRIFDSHKIVVEHIINQCDLASNKYAVFGLLFYNWYVLVKLGYQSEEVKKEKIECIYKMYQELMPSKNLLDSVPEISQTVKELKDSLLNDELYKDTIDNMINNQKETEKLFFEEVMKLNKKL